jgi:glutathione S-transferase
MGQVVTVKLFDWAPSPFSLKVRAILEYKGVPFTRTSVFQPKRLLELRRRGRVGKVPAIEIDGTLFVDSTDIAYEIERRFPAPPIIPGQPRERGLCHALEEWSDESLYFIGLYFQWEDSEGRKLVPQAFGSSLYGRMVYRLFLRRVRGQIRGQGTSRKNPEHVRSDLRRHLEAVDTLLQDSPFLLGAQPYLCDFALLGQLVYLGRTPTGSRHLSQHDAIKRYLDRMKDFRHTR